MCIFTEIFIFYTRHQPTLYDARNKMLTMDLIKLVLHLNLFWINSEFFGASVVKGMLILDIMKTCQSNIQIFSAVQIEKFVPTM